MADTPELAFRRSGTGPPLVLVHGYFGGSAHWQGVSDPLAAQHDVIAPCLAGFGESAHLEAPATIPGHAERVLALLDTLGIDHFALLGHSMGGMVVQEMAAIAGPRISQLVLYGTGPIGALPGRFETIQRSRERLHEDGLEATLARIAANWFVAGDQAPGHRLCLETGRHATLQAALASLDAWEAWDGRANLDRITAPTLILWGDRDRSYPWHQIETLWQTIPNAALAVIPNAGHAVHLEKPRLFTATLLDFLASALPAPPD